jgi:transcriptional regulator with XRE-family HTH domain
MGICDCFGVVLREERRARHLSKYEVARRAGLSQSTVADLEKPGSNPRLDTMERIGRALGSQGLFLHTQATRLAQQQQHEYSTIS